MLMNSSAQNWDLLTKAVDCSPPLYHTMFRLMDWDAMYTVHVITCGYNVMYAMFYWGRNKQHFAGI
ncbi:hypothetical protein GQ600_14488 [Phytophthora cactorum]|nr:hypothetical protein GQ600_14488 [Phytophthora cactorum]